VKICFVAPGHSIHSYKWIIFFVKLGYEIHWISVDGFGEYKVYKNLFLHSLNTNKNNTLNKIISIFKIKKIIRKINPDIIHAHSAALYGLLGALSNSNPFVLSAWGSDVLVNKNNLLKRPILKFILKKADLITTDAYHLKNEIIKLGINKSKIEIIMFGIDTDFFKPVKNKMKTKIKLGYKEKEIMILSLRSFYKVYDIETIINAAKNVLKIKPDLKFVLIGSGPEEKKLKALVKDLGLTSNIIFTGRLSQAELKEYMLASDIYVSTALSDAGISASTAEAMSCGLVPIVSNTGENSLWIQNDKNGFLIPPKHVELLSNKILTLINNVKKSKELSKNTRSIIVKNNNYNIEMNKINKIYVEQNRKAI
jgi:L-malate glycosyltransferase